MAEFKKGQKVRVSYEGTYSEPTQRGWHLVKIDRDDYYQALVPSDATIEVIEEPFEEGAIYEFEGGGSRYRMAYLPQGNSDKPWVYISGLTWLSFGTRFKVIETLIGKLAPLAQ